jgi:hypothetical protein
MASKKKAKKSEVSKRAPAVPLRLEGAKAVHVVRLTKEAFQMCVAEAAEKGLTATMAADYLVRYAVARKAALARDNAKKAEGSA